MLIIHIKGNMTQIIVDSGIRVNCMNFRKKSNADKVKSRLEKAGYSPLVISINDKEKYSQESLINNK